MREFSFKFGGLEVRSCYKESPQKGVHITAEIIKLQGESNFVVARWNRKDDDYFDLEFVGSRPFDLDQDDFWYLAEFGQKHLYRSFH